MESFARLINFKNFLSILICLNFINLFEKRALGEVLKNNHIDEIEFENVLNQNSVQFHEYENPKFLFDDFFGLGDPLNESQIKTNFQDLSLQIDSKNLRKIYKEKLLEMTNRIKKNSEDNENDWSFFSKKI